MLRSSSGRHPLGGLLLLLVFSGVQLLGQSVPGADQEDGGPALVRLLGLTFPPLARAAHISGTVDIDVLVGADGKVESTQPLSGPAMLQPAALEAARESQYACRGCSAAEHLKVTFVYRILPTEPPKSCDEEPAVAPRPDWDASRKEATAFAMEMWTCDPAVEIKRALRRARSAKCLYLWKCGLRPVGD